MIETPLHDHQGAELAIWLCRSSTLGAPEVPLFGFAYPQSRNFHPYPRLDPSMAGEKFRILAHKSVVSCVVTDSLLRSSSPTES